MHYFYLALILAQLTTTPSHPVQGVGIPTQYINSEKFTFPVYWQNWSVSADWTGIKSKCWHEGFLPTIYQPGNVNPSEMAGCQGRPLLLYNECELYGQCNACNNGGYVCSLQEKAHNIAIDAYQWEGWSGELWCCGFSFTWWGHELLTLVLQEYNLLYGHLPPWNGLHIHAYSNDPSPYDYTPFLIELDWWKAQADAYAWRIMVTEWNCGELPDCMQPTKNIIVERLDPDKMLWFSWYAEMEGWQQFNLAVTPIVFMGGVQWSTVGQEWYYCIYEYDNTNSICN